MGGWIDVAIPGVIGMWLAVWPQSFYKSKGEPKKDVAMLRTLRIMGGVLLAVAAGYLAIKLGSRR
ncbi:MAG TPA: hypothetical protein VKE98_07055 [Gemmataceae bacterium]|nr:hypothetical protein [Gemmataceae bacterium]